MSLDKKSYAVGLEAGIKKGGGGGEPAQYLKTIAKDETNKKITITDKQGNATEFPYGGSGKKNSYASITKIRDYAHQAVYTDIDYQAAYSFFEKMKPAANVMADNYKPTPSVEKPIGACSAFFFMGMLARMYDWNFNEQESIEVKTPAVGDRYAVTGTGYNANLTKEVVESGEYSEYFDYLPFELVDGVNERGFSIAMLVVPNDYGITTGTTPEEVEDEVSMLMLPRYLLDRAIDIDDAMYYLQEKVSVYNVMPLIEMGYEIHYYVADERGNHGVIEFINNTPIFTPTEIATNFYIHGVQFNDDGTVYTPATQDADHDAMHTNLITEFGSGLERYNLINNTLKNVKSEEDIVMLLMNLMYTNAYKRTTDPFWYTEFVGGKYTVTTSVETYEQPDGIIEKAIAEFGKRDRATGTTWQTVHGGLIDCERKTMYLAFQEDLSETYGFGFNYYTAEQIDDLVNEIGWGNLKYTEYQQLNNWEFNQVMMNLRLDAKIEEYYDTEEKYENNSIDLTPATDNYTITDVDELVFNPDKDYEVILTFNHQGAINLMGHPKSETTLALDGESMGLRFSRLDYVESDIVISFDTDETTIPNLTGIEINELTHHRDVTPIKQEFIPHDDTKQNVQDESLATVAKIIPAAINEVNERVDNISPTGRFLSYWNAATGMPETNPSTIPFEYKSGDWFSISVVAEEGGTNYAPTPDAYDGNPSTIVEKNLIEKGDVYRYDGTVWKWEHTAQRDVQFRDILGSPFDNTALKNALDGKVDKSTASRIVYGTTGSGNPELWNLNYSVTAGSIPIRDNGGVVKVGNALTNEDAVNLGQMNEGIGVEASNRQTADLNLQGQIDALVAASDVVDVVGTYEELQNYDTSTLTDKDVVKVLNDSTQGNARTYYRWIITEGTGAWSYIGSEGISYTKAESDARYVQDLNYVHTDNNFTDEAQQKVADSATVSLVEEEIEKTELKIEEQYAKIEDVEGKVDKADEVPFLLEYADGTSETLNLIQSTPANDNEVDNQGGELDD